MLTLGEPNPKISASYRPAGAHHGPSRHKYGNYLIAIAIPESPGKTWNNASIGVGVALDAGVFIRPQEVHVMLLRTLSSRPQRRGFAIITVLVFLLVVTILLSGIGMYTVSAQTRANTAADAAAALNIAEAGINWEFRKLSMNQNQPDQWPGATVNWGGGTFQVWCANADGTVPWNYDYPNHGDLLVFARGTVDGSTRTVKVKVKGFYAQGNYAIYGTDQISTFNGSSVIIRGDIGTNDQLGFTGSPTIQGGSVYFNGPDAGWVGGDPGGYNVITDVKPYDWPTVSQIAMQMFPQGGLTWLANNNDNARAVPPILGNSITTSTTLPAGNYYLTNVNLSGSRAITFDNRFGPINVWIGPEGSTDVARWRGGTAAVAIDVDPTKAPRVFVATRGGIDLGGNQQFDGLVYAVNRDALGNTYGHLENSGNPRINGQLIADDVDLNGNISVNFFTHLIRPITFGYYGIDNLWEEGSVDDNLTWTKRAFDL